jgi:hypothetical protein
MDATPFGVRAALVSNGAQLEASVEARPGRVDTVIRQVRCWQQMFPELEIVGAPVDRWPPELKVLENPPFRCRWLDRQCSRRLDWAWAAWQKRRRLLRSRLIAYAASRRSPFDVLDTILDWETLVANETLREIEALRKHRRTPEERTNP